MTTANPAAHDSIRRSKATAGHGWLRCAAGAAALLLLLLATGCQDPQVGILALPSPAMRTQIPIQEMACRLGMSVKEVSSRHALLANRTNKVLLMPEPVSRAYVNGKLVGPCGGISLHSGTIWVPVGLTEVIRGNLSRFAPYQPPLVIQPPVIAAVPFTGTFHVVIDAGHGGKDPGAISIYGMHEKHITLQVARNLAARLGSLGVRTTLTRDSDRFVALDERAGIANRANADLFVSIHADSSRNSKAAGSTIYMSRGASGDSSQVAGTLEKTLRVSGFSCRGIRRADYRVLTRTQCPAVLVELGYLSNPHEGRLLAEPATQQHLAECVAQGLLNHIRVNGR